MKNILYLLILVVTFYSCESNKTRVEVGKYEELNGVVRIFNINKGGMDYVILLSYNGGIHDQNLTLDSLQVEYYKQSLNK